MTHRHARWIRFETNDVPKPVSECVLAERQQVRAHEIFAGGLVCDVEAIAARTKSLAEIVILIAM